MRRYDAQERNGSASVSAMSHAAHAGKALEAGGSDGLLKVCSQGTRKEGTLPRFVRLLYTRCPSSHGIFASAVPQHATVSRDPATGAAKLAVCFCPPLMCAPPLLPYTHTYFQQLAVGCVRSVVDRASELCFRSRSVAGFGFARQPCDKAPASSLRWLECLLKWGS